MEEIEWYLKTISDFFTLFTINVNCSLRNGKKLVALCCDMVELKGHNTHTNIKTLGKIKAQNCTGHF